jgi:succinylarginine dihydrolase
MSRFLSTTAGLSAATSGVTGIAATVSNGLELDWGDSKIHLNIPALNNWYTRDLEVPTGQPANA